MASTAAATGNGISLKILVDTKSRRVVFAEAGKDFVDFLFHISYLPVGTNIYQAVEDSSQTITLRSLKKNDILNPKCVTFSASDLQTLPKIQTSTSSTFHVCTRGYDECKALTAANLAPLHFMLCSYDASCLSCGSGNPATCKLVEPSKIRYVEKGYVKSELTYIVMDDLTVRVVSAISGIEIVNGFDIKNVGTLEAREVQLGNKNALELLKASIQSKTVLTDAFLCGDKNSKDSK